MIWLIAIAIVALGIGAIVDAIRHAPIENPKPRIAWDMEPFSKDKRWRVIVPETRGTVVVNEATIPRLERIL